MSSSRSVRAVVLVVDDEATIRESLAMILEFEGYRVEEAASGPEAIVKLATTEPDAVLLDVKMPEMDGLAVLAAMRERGYDMPVVVISGHADLETAVEATKRGAWDFFEKPLQRDRVVLALRNAIETHRLRREGAASRLEPDEMVGDSAALRRLRELIDRAGPTTATVLITGESGTGKELVARALHERSARRGGPMVQVNCAAIPEELIESELFGHEKGSFTGAVRKQVGKFVVADGGTIFLDEIGDMSQRTQAKVLRVLQSGEVEPVGAATTMTVDVRVIAATNRDLEAEIAAGRFREDLYYRLNVVPLRTPPLRERLEDVPLLVEYFARRFGQGGALKPRRFEPAALEALSQLPWKGNVRELKNLVERLLILAPNPTISREDVLAATGSGRPSLPTGLLHIATLRDFRDAAEKMFVAHKLEENGWNITQTAQAIDTPRSNLYKKLEQYDLRRDGKTGSEEDEE